jgi:hypothetical protein
VHPVVHPADNAAALKQLSTRGTRSITPSAIGARMPYMIIAWLGMTEDTERGKLSVEQVSKPTKLSGGNDLPFADQFSAPAMRMHPVPIGCKDATFTLSLSSSGTHIKHASISS